MKSCIKVKFANEDAALFYINKLNKTQKTKRKLKSAYLCQQCLAWHITSSIQVDIDIPKLPVHQVLINELQTKILNQATLINQLQKIISTDKVEYFLKPNKNLLETLENNKSFIKKLENRVHVLTIQLKSLKP